MGWIHSLGRAASQAVGHGRGIDGHQYDDCMCASGIVVWADSIGILDTWGQ